MVEQKDEPAVEMTVVSKESFLVELKEEMMDK